MPGFEFVGLGHGRPSGRSALDLPGIIACDYLVKYLAGLMKAEILKRLLACLVAPAHVGYVGRAAAAGVLDDVKQRGMLRCGVGDELTGFSVKSEGGAWSGFDVDYCHAIAAARSW